MAGDRDDGAGRGGDVPDRAALVDGRDRHGDHGDRRRLALAAPGTPALAPPSRARATLRRMDRFLLRAPLATLVIALASSEESRVGTECVSTGRYPWSRSS